MKIADVDLETVDSEDFQPTAHHRIFFSPTKNCILIALRDRAVKLTDLDD